MNIFRHVSALLLMSVISTVRAADPAAPSPGAITLAPVFGDHAVLQRGKPVPVWGTAGAAETITVTFHGQSATTKAGADGRWSLTIGPFEASSDGADLKAAAGSTLTLHDVVV